MKTLEAAVLAILTVFAPIQAVLMTVFTLILADLATGILAARKQHKPITSAGIKRTVGKVLLYEVALCLSFLVQQYLTGALFPASKVVSALIGLTELKSILENLDIISGSSMFKVVLARVTQSQKDLGRKSDEK